ncbi:MAG: MlaA family lipoprotein [Alphaproteobacteria bacterium]
MKRKVSKQLCLLMAGSLILAGLSGCAGKKTGDYAANDPLEGFNRVVFKFNKGVDFVLLDPVTTIYKVLMPDLVQKAVHNFLDNLSSPVVAANQVLQGDVNGAGKTLGRFALNTTLGVGGLLDVMEKDKRSDEDFGQTLASWGAGHGAYLVLPVIGSTSLRDMSGKIVDDLVDPFNITFRDHDWYAAYYSRMGLEAVSTRARYIDEIKALQKQSTDEYAARRAVYFQRRDKQTGGKASDTADIPE